MAPRSNWSREELRTLIICYEYKIPIKTISLLIGRSPASITKIAFRIGLSKSKTKNRIKANSQNKEMLNFILRSKEKICIENFIRLLP